jgi:molecular chaperone GrpE
MLPRADRLIQKLRQDGAEQDTVQTAGAEAQAGTETENLRQSAGEQQKSSRLLPGPKQQLIPQGLNLRRKPLTEPETEAKQEEPAQPVHDPKDDQIADLQKRLLRLQADFENFRRRNAAEREELSTFVTMDIVGKYLKDPGYLLNGAWPRHQKATGCSQHRHGHGEHPEAVPADHDGARGERDSRPNQKFDPKLHEAVMRGQNPDLEDETIDAVFEKGYELRNHVIRHSKVRVINNE